MCNRTTSTYVCSDCGKGLKRRDEHGNWTLWQEVLFTWCAEAYTSGDGTCRRGVVDETQNKNGPICKKCQDQYVQNEEAGGSSYGW